MRTKSRAVHRLLKCLIVTAAIGMCLAIANAYMLDGLTGFIFSSLENEDTAYASGYTDAGFRGVKVGMSDADVFRLIGQPQKSWPIGDSGEGSETGARWSYSPSDTNFRCRVLLFRDHHVVEKHTEFYLD